MLHSLNRFAEEAQEWAKAAAIDPKDPNPICNQAMALVHAGKNDEGLKLINDHLDRNPTGDVIYNAACIYAQAGGRANSEQYLAQAVTLLVRVSGDGYFNDPRNLQNLKNDDDLKPLANRSDFEKFQKSLPKSAASK